MVSEQRKAVHAFPYIDRSLPIADWNDPMWSTDDVQSDMLDEYKKQLKNLVDADVYWYNQPTAKDSELTPVKWHALSCTTSTAVVQLYNQIKDDDADGTGKIKCRIKAMHPSSLCRLFLSEAYYEKDSGA